MLVIAGPGSGKTTVILNRIKYLIEHYHIPPSQILVISFTKASAMEMQQRFQILTNEQFLPVTFGIFHATFFQILKEYFRFYAFSLISNAEKVQLLSVILENNSITYDTAMIMALLDEISYVKNNQKKEGIFESSIVKKEQFGTIFMEYNKRMHISQKMDFDDMIRECLLQLRKNVYIQKKIQERFRYLLIDEFQDINEMQYEAIKLLVGEEENLFVVGDDDQAIYCFRGASPDIMMQFPLDYIKTQIVRLSMNYRCPEKIVASAAKLIANNHHRLDKTILSGNQRESTLKIIPFENVTAEYDYLVQTLKQQMLEQNGIVNTVILCRTNDASLKIKTLLQRQKIPVYQKEKKIPFYQQKVIRPVIAYLKYATGMDKSRETFFAFMNMPMRYIEREWIPAGEVFIEELLQKNDFMPKDVGTALLKLQKDLETIRKLTPFAAIMYILKAMGYEKWVLSQIRGSDERERQSRLLALLKEESRHEKSIYIWLSSINEKQEELLSIETKEQTNGAQIMTMHSAKGLEFDQVFILDINEGNIPHGKCISVASLEEERRLFYVAITRSKQRLELLYKSGKKNEPAFPSRFIKEMT